MLLLTLVLNAALVAFSVCSQSLLARPRLRATRTAQHNARTLDLLPMKVQTSTPLRRQAKVRIRLTNSSATPETVKEITPNVTAKRHSKNVVPSVLAVPSSQPTPKVRRQIIGDSWPTRRKTTRRKRGHSRPSKPKLISTYPLLSRLDNSPSC
jgi:hypothetical protein